ncbi:MAG: hypothetical protein HZA10_01805 [Nitrospirae bacterium]|nr:hypothetical protein [Nitrospirota bacterium]
MRIKKSNKKDEGRRLKDEKLLPKSLSLVTRHSSLSPVAFFWDESFLWGLMAYNVLKNLGLPFDLVRSADIKKGCLKNYKMFFVPGGWASNKGKALSERGRKAIRDFVDAGGNYLGLCGGAGLAIMDGIGLLNVTRKPTKDRIPSFSGRICLNVKEHPIWNGISNSSLPPFVKGGRGGIFYPSHIFHAYWPSQFILKDKKIKTLATFGDALPDAFSSDLNIGDVNKTGNWAELEKRYQINLDPARLMNEPAIIEGKFGKGKVVLSLVHFDTPDDENGQIVLRNLWEYLSCFRGQGIKGSRGQRGKINHSLESLNPGTLEPSQLVLELETATAEFISFGERNFLWFWRNPMLLQWRRGIRGLEYCTLFVMIKEIVERLMDRKALCVMGYELKEKDTSRVTRYVLRIKKLLIPFIEKSKQLLIMERHALQNGQLSPISPPLLEGGRKGCNDSEIQKIRTELFSDTKSHGGEFKKLIDEVDNLLFSLLSSPKNL